MWSPTKSCFWMNKTPITWWGQTNMHWKIYCICIECMVERICFKMCIKIYCAQVFCMFWLLHCFLHHYWDTNIITVWCPSQNREWYRLLHKLTANVHARLVACRAHSSLLLSEITCLVCICVCIMLFTSTSEVEALLLSQKSHLCVYTCHSSPCRMAWKESTFPLILLYNLKIT